MQINRKTTDEMIEKLILDVLERKFASIGLDARHAFNVRKSASDLI